MYRRNFLAGIFGGSGTGLFESSVCSRPLQKTRFRVLVGHSSSGMGTLRHPNLPLGARAFLSFAAKDNALAHAKGAGNSQATANAGLISPNFIGAQCLLCAIRPVSQKNRGQSTGPRLERAKDRLRQFWRATHPSARPMAGPPFQYFTELFFQLASACLLGTRLCGSAN